MATRSTSTGWIVAGCALALAVAAMAWAVAGHRANTALRAELNAAQEELAQMAALQDDASGPAQEAASPVERQLPPAEMAFVAPPPAPDGRSAENALLGLLPKEAPEKPKGPRNPMAAAAEMFKGEEGEKLAATQAKMMIAMQYEELFDELGLTLDREEAVREILTRNIAEGILAAVRAMDENAEPGAEFPSEVDMKSRQRDELEGVLTADELARYAALRSHSRGAHVAQEL